MSTYGGGWTCSQCGAWVPMNTTHTCHPARWINPPLQPQPSGEQLAQILMALGRIEQLLVGLKEKKL